MNALLTKNFTAAQRVAGVKESRRGHKPYKVENQCFSGCFFGDLLCFLCNSMVICQIFNVVRIMPCSVSVDFFLSEFLA